MPVNISTAVDSLVELVNNKKRIPLEEAAKELGLPEHIINEWAVFLEEEGILTIEYQFTTPFLVAKGKKTLEESRDYSQDIEILTRQMEIMQSGLNKIVIKHAIVIKDVNDVKRALTKKLSREDMLYTQKFVLDYQIRQLLHKVSKLKVFDKENYDEMNKEFENIKRRKQIFDKNLAR